MNKQPADDELPPRPWSVDEWGEDAFRIIDANGKVVMWQDDVSADNAGVYLDVAQARKLVDLVNAVK